MTTGTIVCLGFGYTVARLAPKLQAEGWRVVGTTRSEAKARVLAAEGIDARIWDGGRLPARLLSDADALLVSTPPGPAGCPAFAAAEEAVIARGRGLSWIGYLSTNGVYGDHDGAVVDESSMLRPTSDRAFRRIAAEARWTELGVAEALRVVTFRLPGIYGPGRSALDTVRAGAAQRIFKAGQVFSRAHVDDIASAVKASLDNPAAGDLFNIADDEPAPPQDVIAYACELIGVEPPPLVPIEDAKLSEMGESFYRDNKRVSNALMKAALGVALAYPTYREGLRAIFEAERAGA